MPGPPIAISAMTGEGIDALAALIETRVSGELERVSVTLEPRQLAEVDWLYRNGDVIKRTDNEDGGVTVTLRATAAARQAIEKQITYQKQRVRTHYFARFACCQSSSISSSVASSRLLPEASRSRST